MRFPEKPYKRNEIYIVRSESKRLEFPELCKYVVSFTRQYGYDGNLCYVQRTGGNG